MVSVSLSANCEESFSPTESAMDDSSARMKEGGRGETVYWFPGLFHILIGVDVSGPSSE